MKYFFASLIASVFLLSFAHAEENRHLHMACGAFPPYKIDNQEKPGIDIELMQAAWSVTKWKADYEFYPWKRAVALSKSGEADGLCGCSYRVEREEDYRFSDVMGLHSQGVFVKNKAFNEPIRSIRDLQGKTVATVRGYAVQKELDALGINNTGVLDDKQLVSMLLNDRVDAIYAYRDVVLYALDKQDKVNQVVYHEISSQPYYVCISRAVPDSRQIVDDLNQGMRVIRQNGEYQRIWRSYLATN
ncbi:MAG: amino acid ABC transporter substrate-binding protein [Sneathiella sp.]|nr:amino acid ABC transporter substrate-binding protein [Sneathiella sp.]